MTSAADTDLALQPHDTLVADSIRGVLRVRILGPEMGTAGADLLMGWVFDETRFRAAPLVLDLRAVDSLSTFAIGALVQIGSHRRLRLVGVRRAVRVMLDTLGLRSFFETSESVDAAVDELAAGLAG